MSELITRFVVDFLRQCVSPQGRVMEAEIVVFDVNFENFISGVDAEI